MYSFHVDTNVFRVAVSFFVFCFKDVFAGADVCAVCNESSLQVVKGTYKCVGAPTEAALVVLAEKIGIVEYTRSQALHQQRKNDPDSYPMPITEARRALTPSLALLEFDRKRKSMSVIVPGAKATQLLVKVCCTAAARRLYYDEH